MAEKISGAMKKLPKAWIQRSGRSERFKPIRQVGMIRPGVQRGHQDFSDPRVPWEGAKKEMVS